MRILLRMLAVLAVIVVVLAGVGIAATWAPDRPLASLVGRWAPPPSQFVDVDGLHVHLRDEGPRDDPRPIVLLHGTSASLHTWDGWTAVLRRDHRVIRFDLPGFGLTGPDPTGDYTIARYALVTRHVLNQLGVRHCVLAGNSFGGWVAWEVARIEPDRVDRLVLVDAAGYPLHSQSVPVAFRVAQIPVLNQLVKVTLPRSMIESSVRNVYGDPARVTAELVDRYYELTLRAGNRESLVQRFRQAPVGIDAARVREVRVPTLILWGGRDRLIPPDHAEHFARDIPGSRVEVFDDLGHVPQEEDPARTVAAVQSFLASP